MNKVEILTNDIVNLIKKSLNTEEEFDLIGSTKLTDLGLNSISIVKLVVNIEEVFDIEFDDDQLSFQEILTVNDLVKYIISLRSKT